MEPVKEIDLQQYPRLEHFRYFSQMAYPYVGVTVQTDITAFLKKIKKENDPFFLSFLYCVDRAANAVAPLRQRIWEGKILEYSYCLSSHTVAIEDGTYSYCRLDARMPFHEFLPAALEKQALAKQQGDIEENEDSRSYFFISTIPWFSYTQLTQAVPSPADSNPRITWGKYYTQGDHVLLPFSLQCNHALVDGLHMSQFFQKLEQEMLEF